MMSSAPRIVAHRGYSGRAPENTLSALRLAIATAGVDAVEFDVRCTADGVPVVIHDVTVERTTDGRGAVDGLRLEQLRRLNAAARWPGLLPEPVPTLADVLALDWRDVEMVLEIKPADIEPAVAEALKEARVAGACLVASFHYQVVVNMARLFPFTPRALIVAELGSAGPAALVRQAVRANVSAVMVRYTSVYAPLLRVAQRDGLQVYAWTVDEPREAARLVSLGVDGIISNEPERILPAIANL